MAERRSTLSQACRGGNSLPPLALALALALTPLAPSLVLALVLWVAPEEDPVGPAGAEKTTAPVVVMESRLLCEADISVSLAWPDELDPGWEWSE